MSRTSKSAPSLNWALDSGDSPEQAAARIEWEAGQAEHERTIAECKQHHGDHAWLLVWQPAEVPEFECEHCPAHGGDLLPGMADLLYGEWTIGRHAIEFGKELPEDATPVRLAVGVAVENVVHPGGPWGATEYDVEIYITERAA